MAKQKKRQTSSPKEAKYELTDRELPIVKKYVDRLGAKKSPRIKVEKINDVLALKFDHPDQLIGKALLSEALGGVDDDFLNGFLSQLASAGSEARQISDASLNFMLSVIKGIEPRDQLEAMLAAQMAAVHMATMTFARRLALVENIPQQDSAERAFNKLARTFVSQMEALKRYRTGGEQKVTVQHVSVSEGGQAIVGNVTQTASEKPPDKAAATPPALTDAKTAAMPIIEENKETAVIPARRGRDK